MCRRMGNGCIMMICAQSSFKEASHYNHVNVLCCTVLVEALLHLTLKSLSTFAYLEFFNYFFVGAYLIPDFLH